MFRLRESEASLTSIVKGQEGQLQQLSCVETRVEARNTINIHLLLQCLNGQIAPGLWITAQTLSDIGTPVPPYPSPLELTSDPIADDRFCKSWCFGSNLPSPNNNLDNTDQVTDVFLGLASVWNQTTLSPGLESHDALTRMLFFNC